MPEREITHDYVYAGCPACGGIDLGLIPSHSPDIVNSGDFWELRCLYEGCPDPEAAAKLLSNPEIHHIVQFQDDSFTVKHPLRERIDDNLFDCSVYSVVVEAVEDGRVNPTGAWRVRGIPAIHTPGGPGQQPDWEFEQL